MNAKIVATIVAVAMVFGGGGFYGGMAYQKAQTPAFGTSDGRWPGMMGRAGADGQGGAGGNANGNRRFFGQGGRPVSGEIISQDDKSITVKLADGSTKIVMLSDKTEISKASTGNRSDLKKGERVFAAGTENSDGSITANIVSIGGRFGMPDTNRRQ
ncbi:MAG: hypothetical protein K6T91_00965 [Firmicutes bacterium]|nr:hypothetical protein [Bacillota bacterium]